MVNFDFYVSRYRGSLIPENVFEDFATRAQQYLQQFKRNCRVVAPDETAELLALCAMAEVLYYRRDDGVAQSRVGSVSVQYRTEKTPLQRELYQKACVYLDIYRGVM